MSKPTIIDILRPAAEKAAEMQEINEAGKRRFEEYCKRMSSQEETPEESEEDTVVYDIVDLTQESEDESEDEEGPGPMCDVRPIVAFAEASAEAAEMNRKRKAEEAAAEEAHQQELKRQQKRGRVGRRARAQAQKRGPGGRFLKKN